MSRLLALALAGLCLAAQADEPPGAEPHEPPRADAPGAETAGGAGKPDRLELETTSITGNQELPKVLYIVPWKKPLPGTLPGPPISGLLEEVLAPVDREVFRRHVDYFEALNEDLQGGFDPPDETAE